MSENDFECFASTGVKSPLKAMCEQTKTRYPQVQRALFPLRHKKPESGSLTRMLPLKQHMVYSSGIVHHLMR